MFRATKTAVVAIALTAGALTFSGPVHAAETTVSAKDYANCDAMHRDFKHGVAKSKKAARKQVKNGMERPAVRAKVYRANDESDADNDGTACEVSA